MADDRALRLQASRALAKTLGDPAARKLFELNDYRSGQHIVLALESDTVKEVFDRVREYPPPVTVAVYWPERGELEYSTFTPDWHTPRAPEQTDVGGASTIGMLLTYHRRQSVPVLHLRMDCDTLKTVPFLPPVAV